MYVMRVEFGTWVKWEEKEGVVGCGSSETLKEVFISQAIKGFSRLPFAACCIPCDIIFLPTKWALLKQAKIHQIAPYVQEKQHFMCRTYMIWCFDETSHYYSLLSRTMNIWHFIVWFKEILSYCYANCYLYQPQILNHHHLRQFSRN